MGWPESPPRLPESRPPPAGLLAPARPTTAVAILSRAGTLGSPGHPLPMGERLPPAWRERHLRHHAVRQGALRTRGGWFWLARETPGSNCPTGSGERRGLRVY